MLVEDVLSAKLCKAANLGLRDSSQSSSSGFTIKRLRFRASGLRVGDIGPAGAMARQYG